MEINDLRNINWPKELGKYKVLQIDIENTPILRLQQNAGRTYHSEILSSLIESLGMEVENEMINKVFIPKLKTNKYSVKGMGLADIDTEQKIAKFYGCSADYEIAIDKEHLRKISELEKEWTLTYNGIFG